MTTLTAIREARVVIPIPIQMLFGATPLDGEFIEVFAPQPRWDEPELDEALDARCSTL